MKDYNKVKALSFRLKPEAIKKLKALATSDDRSMSNWMENTINTIYKKMEDGNMKMFENFEKQFGSVEFEGKKYALKENAYCDNYGTDGEVVYYAHALGIDGKNYKVCWDTIEKYDKACELLNIENELTDLEHLENNNRVLSAYEQERLIEIKNKIQQFENEGISSAFADDESNACDWDSPSGVWIDE